MIEVGSRVQVIYGPHLDETATVTAFTGPATVELRLDSGTTVKRVRLSCIMPAPVPSPEERRQEIRRLIAARGWTTELERIGSMRVALAMQACGLEPFTPEEAFA